ncbi:hypothetical protein BJF81_08900 [Ornithinimicrobium sp. CNJ-824]|nr:hypothetical protein BJF81_08900 [Ornithinimicrobium sp. CNJ-824]
MVGALALAAALTLGACSAQEGPEGAGPGVDAATATAGDGATGTAEDGSSVDAAGTTVDPDELPDPVAEVEGEEISRADFVEVFEQQRDAARQQAEAAGSPVDEAALRDGVLESLVASELLRQEGERLGLEADAEEVDAELASLAEQNGLGSADELVAALGEQGLPEEQVREEMGRLLLIEEIVAERGGVEPPTEQELQDYYAELTEGMDGAAATDGADGAEGVPPFEDVRDVLEQQLTEQRENEALTTILDELEADAEITRHL